MSWVEIVSAVLGLTCVFLAGRNSKYNFYVGYVNNVFMFVLYLTQHLYSVMILQPVSLAINIYGLYRWTHPKEDERSASDSRKLRVGHVSWTTWAWITVVVAALTVVWAMVLNSWTDDRQPLLGSFIVMLTLLAQWLSARKYWECWAVWLVVNALNLSLHILSGLYLMSIVNTLYIINGVVSLISWKKKYNRNE